MKNKKTIEAKINQLKRIIMKTFTDNSVRNAARWAKARKQLQALKELSEK